MFVRATLAYTFQGLLNRWLFRRRSPDHTLLGARFESEARPGDPNAPPDIKKFLSYGAGPRASQYLVLGAKAVQTE